MVTAGLDEQLAQWKRTADEVLLLARVSSPTADGPAADAAAGEEEQAEGDEADVLADRLIADTEAVLAKLGPAIGEDSEAHAQVTALMVADLVTANALLASADDFEADAGGATFEDQLAELTNSVIDPSPPLASGDAAADAVVPADVVAEFEEIEKAAGTETFELLKNGAIQYSAVALDRGLAALLRGEAAVKFEEIRKSLRRVRDSLKRAATKIVAWITGRLEKLLPQEVRDKLDKVVESAKEKLEAGAGGLIGSGLGRVLGRGAAEKRWTDAMAAGRDLTEALAKVGEATAGSVHRLKWVTKGREAIDKFGVSIVIALAAKVPAAQIAYFCAVAAVFAFVCWQLGDGIADIGRLAPA